MASAPPASAASAGRRASSRLRTRIAARLITLGGRHGTILLDLSVSGARIKEPDDRLRPGQEVVLTWGRFEAFGSLVWVGGGECGIAFDTPLDPRTILETREAGFLPSDRELVRVRLREWVTGERRV